MQHDDNAAPLCKVHGCRFPQSHVTAGHRCGTCNAYGHGQLECGRGDLQLELSFVDDRMPIGRCCTVENCVTSDTHSTAAHHCDACGTRGGCQCRSLCLILVKCPTGRTHNMVDVEQVVFTDATCCVCMDSAALVVFPLCRHATVCRGCVRSL